MRTSRVAVRKNRPHRRPLTPYFEASRVAKQKQERRESDHDTPLRSYLWEFLGCSCWCCASLRDRVGSLIVQYPEVGVVPPVQVSGFASFKTHGRAWYFRLQTEIRLGHRVEDFAGKPNTVKPLCTISNFVSNQHTHVFV